jgi:hypothetical protein
MPESRRRKPKKSGVTVPAGAVRVTKKKGPSPPWVGALIVALFLIGVAWLLLYYFSSGSLPGMSALAGANIFIGFGFVVAGLAVATQWR